MPGKLTKVARAQAEQQRISQLTDTHDKYFKVIFSHQVENAHQFGSLDSRAGGAMNALKMFKAFGKFMDDTVKLTITDVEKDYKRKSDTRDGTHDPETQTNVQVEHFALYPASATPDTVCDGVRLHGYFRNNGGYFVVTRLDWFHSQHS